MVMRLWGFLYESNILVIRVMCIAICFKKNIMRQPICEIDARLLSLGS